MRRLLLVSYYFPPVGGSGVFRPVRLAKYLPRHGFDVTVLTVDARVRAPKDPSLEREVGTGVRVERARSIEPRSLFIALGRIGLSGLVRRLEPWLMLPDDQIGWVLPASRHGVRVLRREPHDVVLTTAGPYSAHLVGLRLSRALGIPWVADFRDEWTTNPYLRDRYPTRWHRERNRRLEREVLAAADRVTCVSRPWLDTLRSLAPPPPADKWVEIPNGFDGAHFVDAPRPAPERFRVVYTGTFYGHRSPRTFLAGLGQALAAGLVPVDDLEVVLMGQAAPGGDGERDGIPQSVLRIAGRRPYFEALELIKDAAVLLLVVPRAGGAGNHTGKLFPYLASGRPILALAPEPNVAATLIRETESGIVVPPDDPAAVRDALGLLYRRWRSGQLSTQRRDALLPYEASQQAARWAELLEDVIRAPQRRR